MITHNQFKEAVAVLELYMKQVQEGIKRAEQYQSSKLSTLICEEDLTIRTIHVLQRNNVSQYDTMESLSKLSRKELRKTRQCGSKTITEIESLCNKAGIILGE